MRNEVRPILMIHTDQLKEVMTALANVLTILHKEAYRPDQLTIFVPSMLSEIIEIDHIKSSVHQPTEQDGKYNYMGSMMVNGYEPNAVVVAATNYLHRDELPVIAIEGVNTDTLKIVRRK